MIKEINVENGFTSDEALAYIKQVLSNSKKTCIYIIHGYGSSGKGELEVFLTLNLKTAKQIITDIDKIL